MSMKLLGIISMGSIVIDLLPIRFSTFTRYYRKKWKHNGTVKGKKVKLSPKHHAMKAYWGVEV
jgi:hypothetical protein